MSRDALYASRMPMTGGGGHSLRPVLGSLRCFWFFLTEVFFCESASGKTLNWIDLHYIHDFVTILKFAHVGVFSLSHTIFISFESTDANVLVYIFRVAFAGSLSYLFYIHFAYNTHYIIVVVYTLITCPVLIYVSTTTAV